MRKALFTALVLCVSAAAQYRVVPNPGDLIKTGGGGIATIQDNAGTTYTGTILKFLNSTYLTCTIAGSGTVTAQCLPDTTKLVDRTTQNTWSGSGNAVQIFTPAATNEVLRLTPSTNPSAPTAGALNITTGSVFNWFDGTNWNTPLAYTTATPTTGYFPKSLTGTNVMTWVAPTGTGSVVLNSAPSVVNPSISDGSSGAGFTNAQHDHSNTANGGLINSIYRTRMIEFTVDGGGAAIGTGTSTGKRIPVACTITEASLVADQSGSIVVRVEKATWGASPSFAAISASAKPTLSAAQTYRDTTLTGWTTSVAVDDLIRIVVESASTVQTVNVQMNCVTN